MSHTASEKKANSRRVSFTKASDVQKRPAHPAATNHNGDRSRSDMVRRQGFKLHPSPRRGQTPSFGPRKPSPFYRPQGNNTLGVSPSFRIIPVGGLEQVGGNMTVFEYGEDIIIVDMGALFADYEVFPGADIVLPDVSYLEENKHRIRGLVITHGHLDHIGGIQYLIERLGFPPIYAGKFAAGLIKKQLDEARLLSKTQIHEIDPDKDIMKFGALKVGCYRNAHSIPDGFGLAIKSPQGTVIWSGDFKFDFTPLPGDHNLDIDRLKYFVDNAGGQVLAAFADSTNVEKPGWSPSESLIVESLEEIISGTHRRIILSMFSSLVMRLQGVLHIAEKTGRKVFLSGRSMENNIRIAAETDTIKVPLGVIQPLSTIGQYRDDQIIILTTGSQGEELAALSRMANGNHKDVKIKEDDLCVFSSSQIPGNERSISRLMDSLCKQGAEIIYNKTFNVHGGGHAQAEDLKLFHSIIKPKYIVPIHGEYHMLQHHKRLMMKDLGFEKENVLLAQNSQVIEFRDGKLFRMQDRIKSGITLVQGNGIGDVGESVVSERVQMSKSGMFMIMLKVRGPKMEMVGQPEIITRGFVFTQSSQELLTGAADIAKKLYANMDLRSTEQINDFKYELHKKLARYFNKELNRDPLIIPILTRI